MGVSLGKHEAGQVLEESYSTVLCIPVPVQICLCGALLAGEHFVSALQI